MRIALCLLLLALLAPASATASPEPPPPGTPPSLTGLERTNPVFLPRYLRQGGSQLPDRTTFSFFMNQRATATVVFRQVLAGGRLAGRGQIVRGGTMGKNRIHFTGFTRSAAGATRRLGPGRYRAFFTSRNEFGSSPTSAIGFRIARPRR